MTISSCWKQRKTIESVQEQIRYAIPDIVKQIHEHDRQAYEQEHGQKFEQTMQAGITTLPKTISA